jgi:hypothetical protein
MIRAALLILLAPALLYADGSNAVPPVKDVERPEALRRELRRLSENVLPAAGGDRLFYRDVKNARVGVGTTAPGKTLEVKGGDVYLNQTSGRLILKSPDGTCSSCGPDNADTWSCSSVTCP